MATNQELRHASVCTALGTTPTNYNADWSALFDDVGIPEGPFNGRFLAWINDALGTSYTSLPGAMQAFAADQGFASWDDMGTFDAAGVDPDVEAWASAVVGAGGGAPSAARKALLSTLVGTLKASGDWDSLSSLQVYASETKIAGTVDIRYPSRIAVYGAAATYLADRSAQGADSLTGYLDTQFNPTTDPLALFGRDDNALGYWCVQAQTLGGGVVFRPDVAEDDNTNYGWMLSTDTPGGGGNQWFGANGNGATSYADGNVITGSFQRNRTATTTVDWYRGGAFQTTGGPFGNPLLNFSHHLFTYNAGAAPRSDARIAAYWAGKGDLDAGVMHSAASAYLTAIGAI